MNILLTCAYFVTLIFCFCRKNSVLAEVSVFVFFCEKRWENYCSPIYHCGIKARQSWTRKLPYFSYLRQIVLQVILWVFITIWWNIVLRIIIFPKESLTMSSMVIEGLMCSAFRLVGLKNSQMPSRPIVWPSDHQKDNMSCSWPFYSLKDLS